MNFAWKGQEVIAGYGKEQVAYLRAVSSKYDTDEVFQEAVPDGLKLC